MSTVTHAADRRVNRVTVLLYNRRSGRPTAIRTASRLLEPGEQLRLVNHRSADNSWTFDVLAAVRLTPGQVYRQLYTDGFAPGTTFLVLPPAGRLVVSSADTKTPAAHSA